MIFFQDLIVWFKGEYRGVGFEFCAVFFRLLNNRYRQWVLNWNSSLSSDAMGDNNRVYIGIISVGNFFCCFSDDP